MHIILIDKTIFSFDGTVNTIVDLTITLHSVQGNNPRSISFMIQTTYTADCAMIISTGTASTSHAFGIGFSCDYSNDVYNIIQVYSHNADYRPKTGKVVNDGLWHTVLVTYDGTTLSIYVDGILDNTATNWNSITGGSISSTLNTLGNNNYLGQYVDGSFGKWIGQLKNVNFYNYVITNTYALANSYQLAGGILYTSGRLSYIYVCIYIIHTNLILSMKINLMEFKIINAYNSHR